MIAGMFFERLLVAAAEEPAAAQEDEEDEEEEEGAQRPAGRGVGGVRALLAVPPAEVAKWMVFDAPVATTAPATTAGSEDDDVYDDSVALIGGESIGISADGETASVTLTVEPTVEPQDVGGSREEPIDMTVVNREVERAVAELKRTEAELVAAKQQLASIKASDKAAGDKAKAAVRI